MERPIVNVVATGTTRDYDAQYNTNVLKAGIPFADQVTDENTIYVIKWDFDLGGEEVEIPANCVLQFEGGSLSNGTLVGNNTIIDARFTKIFGIDITLRGTWSITEVFSEWFGAKADGITDSTNAIVAALRWLKPVGGTLKLLTGVYLTEPIDLTEFRNICIEGCNSGDSRPWISQTQIKIISNGEVGIRLVPEYDKEHDAIPDVSKCCAYSTFKNFYLNCDYKVNKGINANWSIVLENIEVRYSNGDGIVLEAHSYPVTIIRCHSSFNKRHGLSVLGPDTTCNYIDNLDSSNNEGYGMYVEDGHDCSFNNVILQHNLVGGLKVVRGQSTSRYHYFIGFIDFRNLYTEQNGKLLESDERYEGNYATLLDGTTTTIAGKLDNIHFYGCRFNASNITIDGEHIVGQKLGCVNTYRCIFIGCNDRISDWYGNIPMETGRIQINSFGFNTNGPFVSSFDEILDQFFTKYNESPNRVSLFVKYQGTYNPITLTRNVMSGFVIRNRYNINIQLRFDNFEISGTNIYLKLNGKHIDTVYSTYLIGQAYFAIEGNNNISCVVLATASEIYFVKTDGTQLQNSDINAGGWATILLNGNFTDD